MNLLTKFSLIFLVVFGLGLSAAALVCQKIMQRNAREHVLLQAHMLMDTAQAARTYTMD